MFIWILTFLLQIKPDDHQPIPEVGEHVPDHPEFHQDIIRQVAEAEGTFAEVAGAEKVEGLVHPLIPCLAEALLVELVILEQVAQCQRNEVQDKHQERLVFEGEKDAVPTALLALESVVLDRAGACAADVVALGGGAEDVFVTGVVGAPAQVDVLEVGEEVLVEIPDFVQNALAVEGRTAAGREDALLLGVPAGTAAVAGLAGKTHPCDVIACVVGQLPVEVAYHEALDGKNFGVALGHADELGQPFRLCKGVVVEQDDELAFCPGNALIDRMGKAGVGAVFNQGEVRAVTVAPCLREAFVGGTVVHHDEFEVLLRLGVDRLDGIFQPALAVDVRDDDGRFYHITVPAFVIYKESIAY